MENILTLVRKLPLDKNLFKLCKIQLLTIEELGSLQTESFIQSDWRLELRILIEYDLAYDKLYQGSWNEVPEEYRRMFQVLTFLKAFCAVKSEKRQSLDKLLLALRCIDVGIVVGSGLNESHLLTEFAQLLHELIGMMTESNINRI